MKTLYRCIFAPYNEIKITKQEDGTSAYHRVLPSFKPLSEGVSPSGEYKVIPFEYEISIPEGLTPEDISYLYNSISDYSSGLDGCSDELWWYRINRAHKELQDLSKGELIELIIEARDGYADVTDEEGV